MGQDDVFKSRDVCIRQCEQYQMSGANESFEEYSIHQLRDLKSRQTLSLLLQTQIDTNQQLREENHIIRQNQKKLLLVLQAKDRLLTSRAPSGEEVQRSIEISYGMEKSHIRELQVLRDSNQQLKFKLCNAEEEESNLKLRVESEREERVRVERRVMELEMRLEEKEGELEEVRRGKSEIHDKIERENEQYVQEILRINEKFMEAKQEREGKMERSEREREEMSREILHLKGVINGLNSTPNQSPRKSEAGVSPLSSRDREKEKQREREITELKMRVSDYKDELEIIREQLHQKQRIIQEQQEVIENTAGEYEMNNLKYLINQRELQNSNLASELHETRGRLQSITEEESQLQSLKSVVETMRQDLSEKVLFSSQLQSDLLFKEDVISQLQATIKQLQTVISQKMQFEIKYQQMRIDNESKTLEIQELKLFKEEWLKTVEKRDKDILKLREANMEIEKEYRRENQEEVAKREKLVHENRRLKDQLGGMEKSLGGYIQEFEEKYKRMEAESEGMKGRNKALGEEVERVREECRGLEEMKEGLEQRLGQKEREILGLNRRVTESQEESDVKVEAGRLKKELAQVTLKLNSASESNSKLKQQSAELTRQALKLNEQNISLKKQLQTLQSDFSDLQRQLSNLNHLLQQKSTSNNKDSNKLKLLLQQNKNFQLQIIRINNQLKTHKQLLQAAKKVKAQQIINLNRHVNELQLQNQKASQQIQEVTRAIESCNKDKINLMRENTLVKESTNKVHKDNGYLKKELEALQGEILKLQKLVEEYEGQLEMAYNILKETDLSVERFEELSRSRGEKEQLNGKKIEIERKINNYKKEFNIE